MARPDFVVVGAGPAGAAFAYAVAKRGYTVHVYDQAPWPAFKACGWAVPRQIETLIPLPKEVVLTEIRGFRVYLDGRLVHEKTGPTWGYIVDKRAYLEYLMHDAEVRLRRPVKVDRKKLRVLEGVDEPPLRSYVLAPGSATFPQKERIYAVQQLLRLGDRVDHDTVEFWFERDLVGYFWVFPRSEHVLDVGVGGYGDPQGFVTMLKEFIKRRFSRAEYKPLDNVKGSWINVGGVDEQLFYSVPPVLGEAAGFVFPLTGEGIRPAVASALAAAERVEGQPLPGYLSSIVRWIGIQRQILDIVKKSSPESRARLLARMPLDVFIGIGVGELSPLQLLRALPSLPGSIAAILRNALKKGK